MYSEIGKKYYFCILYDGNADCTQVQTGEKINNR